MVARNHDRFDSGRPANTHRLFHLVAGRINETGQTRQTQISFNLCVAERLGQTISYPAGIGQYPDTLFSPLLRHNPDNFSVSLTGQRLSHRFGGPLCHDQKFPVGMVYGSHALPVGIKRQFGHTGEFFVYLCVLPVRIIADYPADQCQFG